ncbi:uncharacterized protein LOC135813123 [Sycon ciliatum]|uniref:uncharacterized protein LOC135813123 n=1 Tax=Sycon ciliatum TaxID=27933 RepID=UPI0031F6C853
MAVNRVLSKRPGFRSQTDTGPRTMAPFGIFSGFALLLALLILSCVPHCYAVGWQHCDNVTDLDYLVLPSPKTKSQASQQCQRSSQGAEIAGPRNQAENDCLHKFYPLTGIWLGISLVANKWQSSSGEVTWTNFAPGEPNGGDPCLQMWNGRYPGKWDDLPCASTLHFICQRVAVKCNVSAPVSGSVNVTSIHIGESVQYECNTGYELVGPAIAQCTSQGSLTEMPICRVENNDGFPSLKRSAESLSNGLVLELFQLKETEKLTFKAFKTWHEEAFPSLKRSAESLSNGLVLELFRLKETEKLTFKAFKTWLEEISGRDRSTLNSKVVSGKVKRLKDRRTYLLKAKKEQWHLLSEQVFELPAGEAAGSGTRAGSSSEAESKSAVSSCDQATVEMMAAELVSMEGELATVNKRKDVLEETVKRQRDKIRNATKKMKQ